MKVGVDIVSVAKMRKIVRRWGNKFLLRVFSEEELTESKKIKNEDRYFQFLSGRFAAKEAIIKALDSKGRFALNQIVIERRKDGAPVFLMDGIPVALSISHTQDYAVAVCVVSEGDEK